MRNRFRSMILASVADVLTHKTHEIVLVIKPRRVVEKDAEKFGRGTNLPTDKKPRRIHQRRPTLVEMI